MLSQLLRILRESVRAVPAMKYALAVAGLVAVVAMVGALKISPAAAVFGAVIILVLMVTMVIFARLTTVARKHFLLPVQIMMWSFLVVTVATAFLLFTCAFFRWPNGLRDLIDQPKGGRVSEPRVVESQVADATLQLNSGDYSAAWQTIQQAVSLDPDSTAARQAQVQIAMSWLRNMRVTAPATFREMVPPLQNCLYSALAKASGSKAADLHAHIGWGNFLRYREGQRDLKIEEHYAEAVKLDPDNPFAHAMWGHWLATQRRPVSEVRQHFQKAQISGREREFVRQIQIAALDWPKEPDYAVELLRMADEMRRNKEALTADQRSVIYNSVYSGFGRNNEREILSSLDAVPHLATFRWLTEGRDLSASGIGSYYLARLTEASGDLAKAAELYETIEGQTIFDEKIKAGIARSRQQ